MLLLVWPERTLALRNPVIKMRGRSLGEEENKRTRKGWVKRQKLFEGLVHATITVARLLSRPHTGHKTPAKHRSKDNNLYRCGNVTLSSEKKLRVGTVLAQSLVFRRAVAQPGRPEEAGPHR